MNRFIIFVTIIFISITSSWSQSSKIHYIPPFFSNDNYMGDHYLVLTTYSEKPFLVNIYNGNELIDKVRISREKPKKYDLGQAINDEELVLGIFNKKERLNKPLDKGGLVLKGSSDFIVSLRSVAGAHAATLTSVGDLALGKSFRTGHMFSIDPIENGEVHEYYKKDNNFISIIASEDNTIVKFSEIKEGVNFYGFDEIMEEKDEIVFKLNKHQSLLVSQLGEDFTSNYNGGFGTKVNSNKPIAINCGSINNHLVYDLEKSNRAPNCDYGFVQIVPDYYIGSEYIVIKGEGSGSTITTEQVVVVATSDKTEVYTNDKLVKTINKGEFVALDGNHFGPNSNMYIRTSNPVYVYQTLVGSPSIVSGCMNFIPPLDECKSHNEVLISHLDLLGEFTVLGVITKVGSSITVEDTKKEELIYEKKYTSNNVHSEHTEQWVTDKIIVKGKHKNITVKSDDVIMLSVTHNSGAIGAASYFSGFSPRPNIRMEDLLADYIVNKKLKVSISNNKSFNKLTWYKDGEKIDTLSNITITEPGTYYVMAKTSKCSDSMKSEDLVIKEKIKDLIAEQDEKIEVDEVKNFENKLLSDDPCQLNIYF